MSNETDATENLQTQPEERHNSTSTCNDVDMEVDNATPSAERTRPASGGQPATLTVWLSKKPPKAPSNESKPPKLPDKMKDLQQFFESQPIELQWTMLHKTKSMIGFQEDIRRKSDSLTLHNNATYHDKNDINAEGRPREKNIP